MGYGEVGKDGTMMARENCRLCGRPFDDTVVMIGSFKSLSDGLCPKCLSKSGPLGSPMKNKHKEQCYSCNGTGKVKGYKCVKCNGTGK